MNMFTRHIVPMEGGAELHTRKGWRGASRPAGTNRRRRLTRAGLQTAPLSRDNRLAQTAVNTASSWWARAKRGYVQWTADQRAARLAEEARVIAEAIAADAAKTEAAKDGAR